MPPPHSSTFLLLFQLGWTAQAFASRVAITGWAPVTNMYETVIYVPFFLTFLGLCFLLAPPLGARQQHQQRRQQRRRDRRRGLAGQARAARGATQEERDEGGVGDSERRAVSVCGLFLLVKQRRRRAFVSASCSSVVDQILLVVPAGGLLCGGGPERHRLQQQ